MDTIDRYRELCTDGRAIGERGHSPLAVDRWKSSTIVRLQWECAGRAIEIEHLYGITAQVLPDRRAVAVLRSSPRGRFANALEFFDARGVPLCRLDSPVVIDGQSVSGEFAWFESPIERAPHTVRVVFCGQSDRYYLLDVNPANGAITAVLPLQ
jgi:hypothetical protein